MSVSFSLTIVPADDTKLLQKKGEYKHGQNDFGVVGTIPIGKIGKPDAARNIRLLLLISPFRRTTFSLPIALPDALLDFAFNQIAF
jgi:hypothetical protein